MDIHKPKAAHSWREFAVEIGTIVCGILIALGLEQGVEALRTAERAAKAEELVREEFALNLGLIRDRLSVSECNRAQFRAVERALIATPLDRRVAPLPYLFIFSRPFSWPQWEAALSSGIAGHFPDERRRVYRRIYATVGGYRSFDASEAIELDAAAKLRTLRLPARKLQTTTREELLQAAAQADYQEERIAHNAKDVLDRVDLLGLPPPKYSPSTHLYTPQELKACMDKVLAEEAAMPSLPAEGG